MAFGRRDKCAGLDLASLLPLAACTSKWWTRSRDMSTGVAAAQRGLLARITAGVLVAQLCVLTVHWSSDNTTQSRVVVSVRVTPPSPTLTAIGATVQLVATVADSAGNMIVGPDFVWAASDTAIGRVSTTGIVTAMARGSATVTASAGAFSGSAVVTVSPGGAIASVEVTPARPTLVALGASLQFVATARNAQGDTLGGVRFVWTSSDSAIVRVSATGRSLGLVRQGGVMAVRSIRESRCPVCRLSSRRGGISG